MCRNEFHERNFARFAFVDLRNFENLLRPPGILTEGSADGRLLSDALELPYPRHSVENKKRKNKKWLATDSEMSPPCRRARPDNSAFPHDLRLCPYIFSIHALNATAQDARKIR